MLSLLVALVVFISCTEQSSYKENRAKIVNFVGSKKIIGMISKCENKPLKNAMGMLISKRLNTMIKAFSISYSYQEFDVCESHTILMEKVVEIFLNKTNYDTKRNKSIVEYIITFMPDEMQNQLQQVISSFGQNIFILPLTKPKQFPNRDPKSITWRIRRTLIQNKVKNFFAEDVIIEIVQRLKCGYFAVVQITENLKNNAFLRLKRLRRKLPNVCFKYIRIESQDSAWNGPIKSLLEDRNLALVFIFGLSFEIHDFIRETHKRGLKKHWILLNKDKPNKTIYNLEDYTMIDVNDNNEYLIYKKDFVTDNDYSEILQQAKEIHTWHKRRNRTRTRHNGKNKYWMREYRFAFHKHIPLRNGDLVSKVLRTPLIKPNITQMVNGTPRYFQQLNQIKYSHGVRKRFKLSQCPSCNACTKKCIMEEMEFNNQISILKTCSKCDINYYRDDHTKQCKKCPNEEIQTAEQSSCYDPIDPQDIHITCYIFNFMGLFLTVVTMLVYIRFKDTPIARCSNSLQTVIQLFLMVLFFTLAPILSLQPPKPVLCMVRPLILGTITTGIISTMVCKAEKIIMIFKAKTRMTPKEIFNIRMRLLMISGVIVSVGLMTFSFSREKFDKIDKVHYRTSCDGNKYFIKQCASHKSMDVIILYSIILLLIAIVQAYRGRKLPAYFNEGNSIIVGASITISLLAFMVSFIHSKKYDSNLLSAEWAILASIMITLLVSMHGPKIYVIYFRPHENTREHYLASMLIYSRRRIDHLLHNRRRRSSLKLTLHFKK